MPKLTFIHESFEYEGQPIIIEQAFDAPISAVWAAITDKNQMKQWFFEAIDSNITEDFVRQ